MFFQLCSIETTRLLRRWLPWVTASACVFFSGLSLHNFYSSNRAQLMSGEAKIPGLSFDLATALDVAPLVSLPFLVLLAANLMGNDYTQRTNQHWLARAPRHTGLLAKFAVLTGFTFLLQILILLAGGGVGWYYKALTFNAFSLANVNNLAILAAPFYMTLASLPYLALALLIAVITRSTFAAAAIGLAYTEFVEILLTTIFHGQKWMMWHPRSLATSVTYLLNGIGNRVVEFPDYLAQPDAAMPVLFVYTLVFLLAAVWLYRRQDVGG
ncbi:MAG: hypothetical protein EHM21_10215 [Chloroflexi bacterium]|nr:MAG: hypothetical protein EHM21_10215 [Chloroflexota bacterium]